ncbi:amidohydrolase [Acidicapsa acidisoli]|uniref:amidohydrolase n=1 Tax=Acidicapsa acidisoli TaxID=1615681 RepID=UPI0021E054C2|nr:amidohydrolase [Acidicapsa acidisoli]
MPALVETYKDFHGHPELSHHEEQTSAKLAADLRKLGYQVTERVGVYQDGANTSKAWGIVAVLENGPGPRLLIRTDMDALPVEERTGLDYASHVQSKNAEGQPTGVMHACGHDIHMTVLLGTAKELAARKSQWHGTVMLIGQPSEETIDGSRAMLADHLYERFGKPDFVLSEHDDPALATGDVAIKGGPLLASSTSIDVIMRGIGTHGAHPNGGKDPILMAAEFVVLAQGIISRQIDAQQPAVLTVGTIHGGLKRNIIPDEVTMGLTLRTYSDEVRDQIIAAIRRTADGVAVTYGVSADRMPIVNVSKTEIAPATINDPAFAERLRKVAIATLGAQHVAVGESVMGSEDVGLFSLNGTIPAVMFRLGASDPGKLAESMKTGVSLPSLHSPLFAPVYEPTIRTGVTSLTAMALDVLK